MADTASEQAHLEVASPAGLSSVLDIIGSMKEMYDAMSREGSEEIHLHETNSGSSVFDTEKSVLIEDQLDHRSLFGPGPFMYDGVRFYGNRYYRTDAEVPSSETYDLRISDGNFVVATLSSHIHRSLSGTTQLQRVDLSGERLTPRFEDLSKAEVSQQVWNHRLFPVVLTTLKIGEKTIF
jgi:hypothetical protein